MHKSTHQYRIAMVCFNFSLRFIFIIADLFVDVEGDFHRRMPVVVCREKSRSASLIIILLQSLNMKLTACVYIVL